MAKILVLTPRFPYPIEAGDTLRIYHICKQLSTEHSLTLLSLYESKNKINEGVEGGVFDKIERVYQPKWKSWINSLASFLTGNPLQIGYYKSKKFEIKIKNAIKKYDLALAHLVRTGQYLEKQDDVISVLEMTDALFMNYDRVIKTNHWGLKKIIYRIEKPRMEKYERETIQYFDLVSLVSDVDRKALHPGPKRWWSRR